jgi:2-polyprenyl-3-methyl-5-hydroxy-6-metoxy-1,4-benzoquinol methylase
MITHQIDSSLKHFNDNYFVRNYKNNPEREEMYRVEFERIDAFLPQQKCRVLDVGCGLGNFLAHFNDSKYEKYGVEISEYAINIARQKNIIIKTEEESYDYPENFFDLVIFRGSVQHLPCPFYVIMQCTKILKSGGMMVFLATPNSNSPYYYRFKHLKFLAPETTYLVPSDIMMSNLLHNYGLEVVEITYPYKGTPYAKPFNDRIKFFLSAFGFKFSFAYPKSMMEIFAYKK